MNAASSPARLFPQLLLCLALLALTGCAGVKVSTIDTENYMDQRRSDILSSGELSSYTASALQVLGLDRAVCLKDGEPCRAALYETSGLRDERRLSALAELWLLEAMSREKGKQGRIPSVAAYLETARFAYACLFLTERPMSKRPLEERPTQVRDYYNFAIQQAVSLLFEEWQEQGRGPSSQGAAAGWDIRLDMEQSLSRAALGPQPEAIIPASSLDFEGLRNQYRRDGLGAEMVAALPEPQKDGSAWSQMRYPSLTATIDFPGETLEDVLCTDEAILHIYDPFRTDQVMMRGHTVPLAANFTSGYGLWLARSSFATQSLGTLFGKGDLLEEPHVYLMQPYQQERKTVIMVHGLASSPEAWINVANEIMGDEKLSREYQIWQVYYPTSFPIPINHAEIRKAITQTLAELDPEGTAPASRDILLIGHSMGGILSRLMVSSSGEELWDALLQGRKLSSSVRRKAREQLSGYLFFEPLPQVGRAVFIAAPHRGTPFADKSIARFIAGLVTLPVRVVTGVIEPAIQLIAPELVGEDRPINGIANLSAKDEFIVNAAKLPIAPGLPYHSIIGQNDAAPPSPNPATASSPIPAPTSKGPSRKRSYSPGTACRKRPKLSLRYGASCTSIWKSWAGDEPHIPFYCAYEKSRRSHRGTAALLPYGRYQWSAQGSSALSSVAVCSESSPLAKE